MSGVFDVKFFWQVFVTLLVIMDPPGVVPPFLGLTKGLPSRVRNRLAWQAAVLAGVVIGAGVPASWRLEFAGPLAFIAMTVPLLRDRATLAAALAAGLVVVATAALPLRLNVMLAAVAGIGVGLFFDRYKTR